MNSGERSVGSNPPLTLIRGCGWILLLAILMIARRPDAFFNPQFWAEDAVLFHAEAEEFGAASVFRPALGYYHTIPRIVALATSLWVDAAWQPASFNYSALGVAVIVLVALALGAVAVLVPQAGEILFSLTNVQWLAALIFVICTVSPPPERRIGKVLEALLLLLVGLTGPFVVALLPLGVMRVWRFGRGAWLGLAAMGIAAALQVWAISRAEQALPAGPMQQHAWSEIIGLRLFAQTFLPAALWPGSVAGRELMAWLGGAALAGWAFYPGAHRFQRVVFFAAAVLIQSAVCYRMNDTRDLLVNLNNGPRYFFDARILIAWLLVVVALTKLPRIVRASAGVALAGWAVVAFQYFGVAPLPNLEWARYAPAVREGRPADIPVNPVPYVYHYRGRPAVGATR
jgi:hypothetical protein